MKYKKKDIMETELLLKKICSHLNNNNQVVEIIKKMYKQILDDRNKE